MVKTKKKTIVKSSKSTKPEFNFKTTEDIKVPSNLIGQIVGQSDAVNVIKKAAQQRRHVLLIGEPGTGKSMMGMAMAQLLPKEKLVDVLSFGNPNDENQPMMRVIPAGKGRGIVTGSKLDSGKLFRHQNIILIVLLLASIILPWWAFNHYSSIHPLLGGIMFMSFSLVGLATLVLFMLFLNFGRKMDSKGKSPKVIVDNFGKKIAPFFDATGAHAGALLGDVLHDPFQSFLTEQWLQLKVDGKIKLEKINDKIDVLMNKHKNAVLKKENNYEAIHLDKNELFVLGETNGSVSPVEVLSSNRYAHDGPMIKLSIDGNREIVVTPEHKIAVQRKGKTEYVEAQNIKVGDEVVADSKDIIIDEQDIINTYDSRQQEQCELYYQYQEIKAKNPTWGYKRIAKAMGQKIGKTRWWHAGKHIPVPIQTANWLKERQLLPLKIDNKHLPLIAKVLGATFGDGGVFENLNGIFLSSSEKEAVKEFGKDLEKIFGLNNDENSRIIEGGEYGHSWCYQNTNRNIIRFFLAVGSPKGNKTNIDLIIPSWIKLNDSSQDRFYGAFFGSELGSPSQHIEKNRLTGIEVGITGYPDLERNRTEFLSGVSRYLAGKGISTNEVYVGKIRNSNNKVFRLGISTLFDNVLKFMIEINLQYCEYKTKRLHKALGLWADWKKNKYQELIKSGYGAEHAMKTLNLTPNSLYLLLNHFGPKVEAEATA
jgi:ATP-dependent Lon protease